VAARVVRLEAEAVGTGQMCDTFRLRLTWAPSGSGPPSLLVKLPAADPRSREAARVVRAYEKEVRFYQLLAPGLPVRVPRCWHADLDEEDPTRFVLVLEDLAPARAGDQLAGCTEAEARAALGELARLHAARWGDPALAALPWLAQDPEANAAFLGQLLPGLWAGFQERYADRLVPEVDAAGAQLLGRLDRYLRPSPTPGTVLHGDFRLDNLLFDQDEAGRGRCAVVDWQTCRLGPGPEDLAYFLGASLLPEDRERLERGLVETYHAELGALGVRDYPLAACWADYRRGAWGGLVMAFAAAMLVQRTERGDRMFLCMAERHARQALALDPTGPS
jgi:aminoglycoside phosphotransferase (APT) family kinase protein